MKEQIATANLQHKNFKLNINLLIQKIEMISIQDNSINRINQLFGKMLINISILQNYKNITGNSLILDFKKLIKLKYSQQKQQLVAKISTTIVNLTQHQYQQIYNNLLTSKKTSLGRIITLILMPQPSFRHQLQQKRKQLVKNIRKANHIQYSDQQLFHTLYYTIYSVKKQQFFQNQQRQSNLKKLKSLLMSLKKMMTTNTKIKKPSVYKSKKQSPYPLNLDIKTILETSAKKLQDTDTANKLQKILTKFKHKKWLGPRLYKLLEQEKWTREDIRLLIETLRNIDLRQIKLRSKFHLVRKTIRKVIINLQKYIIKILSQIQQFQQEQNMIVVREQVENQYIQNLQIQDIDNFLIKGKGQYNQEIQVNIKKASTNKKNKK